HKSSLLSVTTWYHHHPSAPYLHTHFVSNISSSICTFPPAYQPTSPYFVSSVFLRDSLFMYPSIKTEPSRQSWTIAGIRPCSSNFIPLKSVISFLSGYRREARGYRFDSPFSSIAHSLLPLALCKSHRDSTLAQIGFRLGNRVGSIVEDGGGQHRVGLAFHESLIQVLERPDAACCNHRN